MGVSGLPVTLLLIEGLVLLALGIRELATRSWMGSVLALCLSVLALLNAWALERRRRARP
ncbi:MAG TPA: hypothetical protein VFR68_10675 [Candidatus Dormibacteraeota bacterium]|nr:hypothetical protein [Candidatus Dormibacteraeota bacterium]